MGKASSHAPIAPIESRELCPAGDIPIKPGELRPAARPAGGGIDRDSCGAHLCPTAQQRGHSSSGKVSQKAFHARGHQITARAAEGSSCLRAAGPRGVLNPMHRAPTRVLHCYCMKPCYPLDTMQPLHPCGQGGGEEGISCWEHTTPTAFPPSKRCTGLQT